MNVPKNVIVDIMKGKDMAWRAAKSLIRLRDEINTLAPHRSKASDGLLGDAAHRSRPSDHNPNAQGIVTAMDLTHDPVNGVDGGTLSKQIIDDARVKYVIFNARIWKARTGKWEPYRGANAHRQHVHVSVKAEYADLTHSWGLTSLPTNSTLRRGDRGAEVRLLQQKLKLTDDGIFGPATEVAVREFQTSKGLTSDGIVGANTWKALNEI